MSQCPNCGAPLNEGCCSYCGYKEEKVEKTVQSTRTNVNVFVQAEQKNTIQNTVSSKSKIVALLLCFFVGILGIHHFYVGKIGMGILYLFTGGLFGIGVIVDFFRILLGSFKDKDGYTLV